MPPSTGIKLYNAGSFFDPRAVPDADYDDVAAALAGLSRVIVESHPALVGRARRSAARRARAASRRGARRPQLEVAMGLETAHPDALDRLNKRFTLDDFATRRGRARAPRRRAARVPADRAAVRALRTSRTRGCSARSTPPSPAAPSVVSLVPTRSGNGAMEALADGRRVPRADARRHRAQPRAGARRTRAAVAACSSISGTCERFAGCPHCLEARRDRLHAMNLEQRVLPPIAAPPAARRARMTLAPVTHVDADVAIVGSGFAGSLTALALLTARPPRRADRTRPPSALRDRRVVHAARQPADRGARRPLRPAAGPRRSRSGARGSGRGRTSPCGLKRGFTFFFHRPRASRSTDDAEHERQLLVAASPHDEIADTHWYRPDFDHALVAGGRARGRRLPRRRRGSKASARRATARRSRATRDGRAVRVTRAVRHRRQRAARLPAPRARPRGGAAPLAAADAGPLHALRPASSAGIGCTPPTAAPPYPIDDAALHHVFPGGWIWILRFNNGITSAGAALTDPLAAALGAAEGAPAWDRLLAIAAVGGAISSATRAPSLPFVHAPRLAFRSARVAGTSWALLPSAAGVIDPLLSTGFPLTLLGILRLLDVLERDVAGSASGTRRSRDVRAR